MLKEKQTTMAKDDLQEENNNGGDTQKKKAKDMIGRDYSIDIEKLRTMKSDDGETAIEAKKLRNEIEQQMEKSFEMIEESQNEVKDYLHKREQEEEEHKRRAANIVKKLQDGMSDVEGNMRNRKKSKEKQEMLSKSSQTEFENKLSSEMDSKSAQTDVIAHSSQDIQTNPEDFEEKGKGRNGNRKMQDIKEDDIPDVIEAIKDDLVEKMKMKLADEEVKMKEDDNSNALKGKLKRKTTGEREKNDNVGCGDGGSASVVDDVAVGIEDTPNDATELDKKLRELAKSVIDSRLNDEETPDEMKDGIFRNKNQLINGLVQNAPRINDVAGIPDEAKKELSEVYENLKNDYENLSNVIGRTGGTENEKPGKERIARCRELCKELDETESAIEDLNEKISSLKQSDCVANGLDKCLDGHLANEEKFNSGTQVAGFKGSNIIDSAIDKNKEVPARVHSTMPLDELIEKKINADAQLNSKLDELSMMLGQGQRFAKIDAAIDEQGDKNELQDARQDSELQKANLKLQKELDAAYRAYREVADKNKKLAEELGSMAKPAEDFDEDIVSGALEISRWETEKDLKAKLDEIEDRIGDELFDDLLKGKMEKIESIQDIDGPASLMLENRTVEELLKDYADDNTDLSQRLVAADVMNDINGVVNVPRTDYSRVIEDLLKEAEKTKKLLNENEVLIKNNEQALNRIVHERNNQLIEGQELDKHKDLLEKELASLNDAIHRCFPSQGKDSAVENLDTKILEIDKQIERIALEINGKTGVGNVEKQEHTNKEDSLKKMLKKLRPFVNENEKEKLIVTKTGKGVYNLPEEQEVDEVVEQKADILGKIQGLEDKNIKVDLSSNNGEDSNPEKEMQDLQRLEELKNDIKRIDKEMEQKEIGLDDVPYLLEIISSLKNSIEEVDKDINKLNDKAAEKSQPKELIEETEKELKRMKEILRDLKTTDEMQMENGKQNVDNNITKENAPEKIGNACDMLEAEKSRLEGMIDDVESLVNGIGKSNKDKFLEFQRLYDDQAVRIKAEIEECLDDVNKVLREARDTLESVDFEESDRLLEEKSNRLQQLTEGIRQISRDHSAVEAFDKDKKIGEVEDPDVEELMYKAEAVQISIDRMCKTIQEHVQNDGDPGTLETLNKRKGKMEESLEGVENEIRRRKKNMEKDLHDLRIERRRIEEEINEMLGDGTVKNEGEKQAVLDLISSNKEGEELKSEDTDLERLLTQRQELQQDFEDFHELGGLLEKDGELMSILILSIEGDIHDRIREINEDSKEYNNNEDLAYEKKYLKDMLQHRAELQGALKTLGEKSEINSSKTDENTRIIDKEEPNSAIDELKKLAENKVDIIKAKIDNLKNLLANPVFNSNIKKGSQQYNPNQDELQGLLSEVTKELNSINVGKELEGDWDGLNGLLTDEIKMMNDMDLEINELFDERERKIEEYVKKYDAEDVQDVLDNIKKVDGEILDQGRHFTQMRLKSSQKDEFSDYADDDIDQEDLALEALLAERDVTIRQLFALKTKEAGRRLTANEMTAVENATQLEENLEERLGNLVKKILDYKGKNPEDLNGRTQSPNFVAVLHKIDEEVDTLKDEIGSKQLFLRGKVHPASSERHDTGEEIAESNANINSNEDLDSEIAKIEDRIEELEERRAELLLNVEETDEEEDEAELLQKREELIRTLGDFEDKLEILKNKEHVESEIEKIESKIDTNENVDQIMQENMNELNKIDRKIAEFVLAIEKELGEKVDVDLEKIDDLGLAQEDLKDIMKMFQEKLKELVDQRMRLEEVRDEISNDRGRLQDLVNRRKDVIEALGEVEELQDAKLVDNSLAEDILKKRKAHLEYKQNERFLEQKKQEIEKYLDSLESKTQEPFDGKQDILSDLAAMKGKIDELSSENEEKDKLLENAKEEIVDLENEVKMLNEELTHHQKTDDTNELEERLAELEDQLSTEREKCREMKGQIQLLDSLKEELRTKGKRVLKIDNDRIQSMSPTKENFECKGHEEGSGDFKHEMDKVSAVEEIMKLAAELITDNEQKELMCEELEAEKAELAQMMEELLNECQAQKEEIEGLKIKLKEEEDKAARIQLEKTEMEKKMEKDSAIKKELEKEIKRLAAELEELMEDNLRILGEVDDLKGDNSTLKEEIAKLKDLIEIMEEERRKDNRKAEEEDIVASESRILMNESDSAVDFDETNEASGKDDRKEIQKDDLLHAEEEIERMFKENKNLSVTNRHLEDKLLIEEKQMSLLEDELSGLNSLLGKKDKEIADCKKRESELRSAKEDLELENKKLEHEGKIKTRKYDGLLQRINELEQNKEELLKNLDKLRPKIEDESQKFIADRKKLQAELREKIDEISNLKKEAEIVKMENEKNLMQKDRKLNKFAIKLDEENEAYEELQRNFDRMKKAKENIIKDYERQIQALQDEVSRLKEVQGKLNRDVEKKRNENKRLMDKMYEIEEQLNNQHKNEIESLMKENEGRLKVHLEKAKQAEDKLEKEIDGFNRAKQRFKEMERAKEEETELLEERCKKLRFEVKNRDETIKELDECLKNQARLDVNSKIVAADERRYEHLQQQSYEIIKDARKGLIEKEQENEMLQERYSKMKEKLLKKEDELNDQIADFQKETRDLRRKLAEKDYEFESIKMKNEKKSTEIENIIKQIEKESKDKREEFMIIEKENKVLKEEIRSFENLAKQLKEKYENDRILYNVRIDELEDKNKMLEEKKAKIQEKLSKEIEENEDLKLIKHRYTAMKEESVALKEKIIELSQIQIAEEKADRLRKELESAKEEYEKLKRESVQVLKHSKSIKTENKQLKQQLSEAKKEHKQEQRMLVDNLENEFRKQIERIINSNLQEKEKIIEMWDEERENWESEMKEEMQCSRNELERKLKNQREDIEKEHMTKLAKATNDNKKVVDELNERLKELEFERSRMEQKFDEEIRLTENQFFREKEYMAMMIRELLRNIVDNKLTKTQMKQNHRFEVKEIEDKFEQDKMYMDMRLKEELQILREKVSQMLARDVLRSDASRDYRKMEDHLLLDMVPRKLK